MLTSLSIKSSPKPLLNSRDSTNCLNFFWVELFMPVDAFSTSTINAGSRPKRWPISSASIPIMNPPALTRLFSAFIACALPTSPVRRMDVPIDCSSGRTRSTVASSPPTMMASSPVRARTRRPTPARRSSHPPPGRPGPPAPASRPARRRSCPPPRCPARIDGQQPIERHAHGSTGRQHGHDHVRPGGELRRPCPAPCRRSAAAKVSATIRRWSASSSV